ncbi:MAG: hypothetical protein ACYCPF_10555, partial [Streptosporangiaceae bacterium]
VAGRAGTGSGPSIVAGRAGTGSGPSIVAGRAGTGEVAETAVGSGLAVRLGTLAAATVSSVPSRA